MRWLTKVLEFVGKVGLLGLRVLTDSIRPPFEFAQLLRHLAEVGNKSLALVVVSGFALGAVMTLHTRSTLVTFGATAMIPAVQAVSFFVEIGPLVAGLLLAGRVGSGIGAVLANMRASEQIDAIESLSIDSFKFLVVPRVLACVMTLPLLTLFMDFAGPLGAILSGYLHLPSFEGRSALTTWFRRIVMNSALMIRRKQKLSRMSPQPETGTSDDAWRIEKIRSSQPDPEMVYAERETFQFINEALGKMKPTLRQAFTMTYCEEMSGPEACALLGVSSAAFKPRLQRARRHLNDAQRTRAVPIHKACRSFGKSYPEKSSGVLSITPPHPHDDRSADYVATSHGPEPGLNSY
jgi:RNA polymerase sigma factor (sigma-70 family)